MDQHDVLELLHQRSNFAYKWLYSHYYVALKNLAFYYVKDSDVSNDMVQDTFFGLLESNKRFESVEQVKYFLYAALKNKCISYLRKVQVRENAHDILVVEAQELEGYWGQVLEEDVYSRLMAAIESLPPQCRLVMQLTLEGLKISDIAEQLKISPETVKEHRATGKKKLAKWMKRADILFFIYFLLN